jgi:peptidoglycan/xylan/chitin deacetylase (PgdA/CDA1 family)
MVHRTPFFLPMLYSSLIWRMPSDSQTLYLTFDDGPVPGPTEFALETLNKNDVKASFFCIGENITKYPELFKKLLDNGHAIGNHTYNHLNGWKTDTDVYEKNVTSCRDLMSTHGHDSTLFRPPFGRIRRDQIRRLQPEYKIIMWDVLSIDYSHTLTAERCLRNTIAAARPGSIIVFHDSYKAEKKLSYALPRLLPHLLEKGFTFETL